MGLDISTVTEVAGSCGGEGFSSSFSDSTWQKRKHMAGAMWKHVSICKRPLGVPGSKLGGRISQRGWKEEPMK